MFINHSCGEFAKHVLSKSCLTTCKRYLQQTHYEVLGLPRNCSTKEVREAFIKLSKRYHPDKTARNSSHKQFVKILEAYSILSKPASRRHYDWELTHARVVNETNDFQEPPRYRSTGYGYDDPSFWDNRKNSGDRFYSHRPYYGIRGLNRVSNGIIAVICIFITTIGVTLQLFAIRHSMTLKRDVLQQRSNENENLLSQIQAEVDKNGKELQIQLMERKFQNNKYYSPQQQNQQRSDSPN